MPRAPSAMRSGPVRSYDTGVQGHSVHVVMWYVEIGAAVGFPAVVDEDGQNGFDDFFNKK